jgi:hypothetical protein
MFRSKLNTTQQFTKSINPDLRAIRTSAAIKANAPKQNINRWKLWPILGRGKVHNQRTNSLHRQLFGLRGITRTRERFNPFGGPALGDSMPNIAAPGNQGRLNSWAIF